MKTVNFNDDDFDFLGFTFQHWRERKKDGKRYFIAKPKNSTWKDFKQKIKAKTKKTLTLNKKEWLERVNLVIRGEVNYFLNLFQAKEENKRYEQESRCLVNTCHTQTSKSKEGTCDEKEVEQRVFARIGFIPAHWVYVHVQYGYSFDDCLDYMEMRQTAKQQRKVLFSYLIKGYLFHNVEIWNI